MADHRASIGTGLVIKDLEIQGSELTVIPRIDSKVPIILRIIDAKPSAGNDGYVYSLHVEGLDEGNYNLANYLKRSDGSNTTIPKIPFEAYSVLKDKWAEPRALEMVKPEKIGGYKHIVWTIAILWVLGFLALLLIKKKRNQSSSEHVDDSISERIYQILKASNNELSAEQKAELDRMLIGHWREQSPELEHRPVADSIAFLKSNKSSAPMLLSIEQWLHSGREISADEVKLTLAPYTKITPARKDSETA